MRMFRKEKLARDKIVKCMEDMGAQVYWRSLNEQEYTIALRKKLCEEALEVTDAKTREELLEELADVYEVIDALKMTHGLIEEEIRLTQAQKREKKGGFFERIYIEKTAYPQGSYWEKHCLASPEKYPEIIEE